MINLAPRHKRGLVLENPLLLGAGTVSYGETLPPGIALAQVGGVVVGPVCAQSRIGKQGPRLAHVSGGLVLSTGGQNRGVRAAVRRFASTWAGLPCAVLVQVADDELDALAETLEGLSGVEGIDAVELLIADEASIRSVRALIEYGLAHCEVPLLVRLPLARAVRLADVAVECGATTLVVGEASLGALPIGADAGQSRDLLWGRTYGPANYAFMLRALAGVRARHPDTQLVAAGGIHSAQMAIDAIALGAQAVMVDSLVWLDPGRVGAIAHALARG